MWLESVPEYFLCFITFISLWWYSLYVRWIKAPILVPKVSWAEPTCISGPLFPSLCSLSSAQLWVSVCRSCTSFLLVQKKTLTHASRYWPLSRISSQMPSGGAHLKPGLGKGSLMAIGWAKPRDVLSGLLPEPLHSAAWDSLRHSYMLSPFLHSVDRDLIFQNWRTRVSDREHHPKGCQPLTPLLMPTELTLSHLLMLPPAHR